MHLPSAAASFRSFGMSWRLSALGLAVLLVLAAAGRLSPGNSGAAPLTAGGYTVSGEIAPHSAAAGDTVIVSASVSSTTDATVLVSVEVHDPAGDKVFQQYAADQNFTAGGSATFPFTWTMPAAESVGDYTLMVGVFSTDWSNIYAFNDDAAHLSVGSSPSAAPSTPAAAAETAAPTPAATPTPVDGFTIAVTPAVLNVSAVSHDTFVVTVTATGAFSQPVTLSLSGLPPGDNFAFTPNPLTPSSGGVSTILLMTVGPTRGSFPLMVVGSGGGTAAVGHMTLVVGG